MTSLTLGNIIPPYHTYNTETQDTKFALPTWVPRVATGYTLLTKEQHAVLCNLREGGSISLNRRRE